VSNNGGGEIFPTQDEKRRECPVAFHTTMPGSHWIDEGNWSLHWALRGGKRSFKMGESIKRGVKVTLSCSLEVCRMEAQKEFAVKQKRRGEGREQR